MRSLLLLFSAAVLIGGACASQGRGHPSDPNLLTVRDLGQHSDLDALEAIRLLRPRWLSRRSLPGPITGGAGESLFPVVVLDGIVHDDLDILDNLSVRDVEEMRYLGGPEATTRFGTGFTNGAILVTTHH